MTQEDWYDRRHELWPEMVFKCFDGSIVKLDHRVPGDGTNWIVASFYNGGWSYDESEIHPGDLVEKLNPADYA